MLAVAAGADMVMDSSSRRVCLLVRLVVILRNLLSSMGFWSYRGDLPPLARNCLLGFYCVGCASGARNMLVRASSCSGCSR